MDKLTSPAVIRELMRSHGVHFSKKLGQNFIVNPSICPRIAEEGGADSHIGALEIGPGVGVLTHELALRCRKVAAVELDSGLLPLLGESLAEHNNVKIIHGDAMKLDLKKLIADEFDGMEVIVCANLPYYVTSPIIMKLLEERLPVKSITVMVQKEAAQRICAKLPSRQAGAVTAAIRYFSEPGELFDVSPGSFMPPPKVRSSVIRLEPRPSPPVQVDDEELFFRVIKAAFAQRRKTLANSLGSGFTLPKETLSAALTAAGIDPGARAEQLSLENFAALAAALSEKE